MQRKTRKIILAVAVIGALAAGGAALTATSTTEPTNIAGYAHADHQRRARFQLHDVQHR